MAKFLFDYVSTPGDHDQNLVDLHGLLMRLHAPRDGVAFFDLDPSYNIRLIFANTVSNAYAKIDRTPAQTRARDGNKEGNGS